MTHELVLSSCTFSLLKELDRMVRAAVRTWLRLPKDCSVPFFYADVEDGGLGLTSLRVSIPAKRANRLRKMVTSHDPLVKVVVGLGFFKRELRKWSKPVSYKDLWMSTTDLARTCVRRHCQLSLDAHGVDLMPPATVKFVVRMSWKICRTFCKPVHGLMVRELCGTITFSNFYPGG